MFKVYCEGIYGCEFEAEFETLEEARAYCEAETTGRETEEEGYRIFRGREEFATFC